MDITLRSYCWSLQKIGLSKNILINNKNWLIYFFSFELEKLKIYGNLILEYLQEIEDYPYSFTTPSMN